MPVLMGLDLETYSSAPLPRCGVYRYCDAPDFEILLFSYAFDDEPVQTIDLARGETLPKEVISQPEVVELTQKYKRNSRYFYILNLMLGCMVCPLGFWYTSILMIVWSIPAPVPNSADNPLTHSAEISSCAAASM